MINWKVRIKQKWFWLSIVPAALVLVRTVAAVAGINLDLTDLGEKLIAVVEAVFTVLVILGIVVDPTTEGLRDSAQAMTYEEPKPYIEPPDPAAEEESEAKHLLRESKDTSWDCKL